MPSSAWITAAWHRSQVATSPQSAQLVSRDRPLRLRMHTTRASERSACTRRSLNSPSPGGAPRRSTTSTSGQPARSADREGTSSGPSSRASSDGVGLTITQGTPSRRARSTSDVAGVPGGRLLLLERLVVLVEHHHRSRARDRCPRRGAGAEHAGRPRPGGGPVVGHERDRQPGSAQSQTEPTHRRSHGTHHQDRPEAGGGHQHRVGVGGRWETDGAHSGGEDLGGEPVDLVRCDRRRGRHGGAVRARQRPHRVRRGRGAQHRGRSARPAPGRPLRQVEHLGRGAPAGDLGERLEVDPGRGLDPVGHHPSPHPTTGKGDAHDRADPDLLVEGGRHDVVEQLVETGLVGADAHHPHRTGGSCARGGVPVSDRFGRCPRFGFRRWLGWLARARRTRTSPGPRGGRAATVLRRRRVGPVRGREPTSAARPGRCAPR